MCDCISGYPWFSVVIISAYLCPCMENIPGTQRSGRHCCCCKSHVVHVQCTSRNSTNEQKQTASEPFTTFQQCTSPKHRCLSHKTYISMGISSQSGSLFREQRKRGRGIFRCCWNLQTGSEAWMKSQCSVLSSQWMRNVPVHCNCSPGAICAGRKSMWVCAWACNRMFSGNKTDDWRYLGDCVYVEDAGVNSKQVSEQVSMSHKPNLEGHDVDLGEGHCTCLPCGLINSKESPAATSAKGRFAAARGRVTALSCMMQRQAPNKKWIA